MNKFANDIDKPQSIIVVSAHWEQHIPAQITSAEIPGIIYDYYGFPQEMYQLEYQAPGNPKLAKKIAEMLNQKNIRTELNPNRGLDHGVWIPLKIMFPNADIPVLQLSIPIPHSPQDLFTIGNVLKPLREKRIMLMASGNLVHNLPYTFRQMQLGKFTMNSWNSAPIETWAQDIDEWLKEHLDDRNFDTILDAENKLPNYNMAAPTTEHFDPLYFTLGSLASNEGIRYIHEGFEAGSISMRSIMNEA